MENIVKFMHCTMPFVANQRRHVSIYYMYTLHKCVMLPTTVSTPSFLSPSPSSLESSHLRELERLRRFGFHTAEVFRAKRAMLAEFEDPKSFLDRG